MVSKRNHLFQGLLFRFHVKFQGCNKGYVCTAQCGRQKPPKRRSSTAGLEGPPGWRDMVGWGVTVRLLKISALEPEQKVKVGKMTSYFWLTEVFFFFEF